MNAKGALISVLCIALVAMLAGAGTLAYFSDTETSTGNTFADGTLDLKVQDWDELTWADGVTATWTMDDMKPGDETVTRFVKFDNFGSVDADHLEITCDYFVEEESPQTESDTDPNTHLHPDWMAKNMTITYMVYQNDVFNINCLTGINDDTGEYRAVWEVNDTDGDGRKTLFDLKSDPLDDLPMPNGDDTKLKMRLKFNETAGNDFQGDTFNLTMIFTLNQDGSQ